MFARILVPLDGFSHAERALPVAARLAKANGGRILLLRVTGMPLEIGQRIELPPALLGLLDVGRENADEYLERVAARDDLAGIPIERAAIEGPAATVITETAATFRADLIIMCARKHSSAVTWGLSSIAQKVARHSPVPVFILHEDGPTLRGGTPNGVRPARALVALDGSARAEAILRPAVQVVTALSAPYAGTLHLVRVLEHDTESAERLHQDTAEAEAYLRDIAERLQAEQVERTLTVTWSAASERNAATTLARIAEAARPAGEAEAEGGYDFVAMATHGRGGLERMLLGSVTEHMLHHTHLPLLVVHAELTEPVAGEELFNVEPDVSDMSTWPGVPWSE